MRARFHGGQQMTPTLRDHSLLAAAFALFAACQSSESAPDAAPPPATEVVTLIFDPAFNGMLVFSSEATGELMDTGTVSASGKASLEVRPGGMVSLAPGGAQLISILNVDPTGDIVWETAARPSLTARSVEIAANGNVGADRYYMTACQDAAFENEEPFSTTLRLDSSCIEGESVTVMSFASGARNLLAYEHASLSVSDDLDLVHEIEWQTSFEESSRGFRPTLLEKPGVELRILVRARPGIVLDVGVARETYRSADVLESGHHLQRVLDRYHVVSVAMKYPGRHMGQPRRPTRVAAAADRHDRRIAVGTLGSELPNTESAHA